jgi:hypothetical protein
VLAGRGFRLVAAPEREQELDPGLGVGGDLGAAAGGALGERRGLGSPAGGARVLAWPLRAARSDRTSASAGRPSSASIRAPSASR